MRSRWLPRCLWRVRRGLGRRGADDLDHELVVGDGPVDVLTDLVEDFPEDLDLTGEIMQRVAEFQERLILRIRSGGRWGHGPTKPQLDRELKRKVSDQRQRATASER